MSRKSQSSKAPVPVRERKESADVPGVSVRIGDISEFKPQLINSNDHTQRGLGALERSIMQDGFLSPMSAVADGEMIDGSARLETSAGIFEQSDVLIVEHDGTRPVVMVRRDIPDVDDVRAKRLSLAANRVAQLDLSWNAGVLMETLRDPDVQGWGKSLWSDADQERLEKAADAIRKKEKEDQELEGDEWSRTYENRWSVPDALWPTDNEWGIPLLDASKQATSVDVPVVAWGSVSRKSRMRGTWVFYVEDYRFEALWKDPSPVVSSLCKVAVEPNYSVYEQMPAAMALWQTYRKRWISRYWQGQGVKILVDLNVAEVYAGINRFGVPGGWKAFCTRGYEDRMDATVREFEYACSIAGTDQGLLFAVYGGGIRVRKLCESRGWVYIMEQADAKKNAAMVASGAVVLPGQQGVG